jgi:hypothetical protein
MKTFAFAVWMAFAWTAAPASAQPSGPMQRRWSVTLGVGKASDGPTGDLESRLRRAGYDQDDCFFGCTSFPRSDTSIPAMAPNLVATVRYALTPHLSLSVTGGSTKLGTTQGFDGVQWVRFDATAAHAGVLVSWTNEILRVGAGPVYYSEKLRYAEGGRTLDTGGVGYLLEAGLTFPRRTRLFADLDLQYRGASTADFGELTVSQPGSAGAPIRLDGLAYGHWSIAVGMGVRL